MLIMKKIILSITLAILTTAVAVSQTPDDAIRTGWFVPNGSARNVAVGGVMGSLGGDISANHSNPAGLGLYKTSEFVFTPGFLLNNNQFHFRGNDTTATKNAFNYGTSGFVVGRSRSRSSKWTSSAFALSINQLANYNNRIYYKGFNNVSSFSEQYLEELVSDNADTLSALSNYIFGSSLAFRTYLIDKEVDGSGNLIGYQGLVPLSTGLIQENEMTTKGGYHEIALGFANNMADKLYLGGSINFPIVSYQRDLRYKETDATNDPDNDFSYFEYTEKFKSSGVGAGLKLGLIYKPQEYFRLGVALHTPSIISFNDEIRAAITTDTENYAGALSESSDALNSGNPGERAYNLISPWRAMASASYVFREVVNTKRQRAFISADVEFVNYRGVRFFAAEGDDGVPSDYYATVNNTVKDIYKGNVNFKLGGELKFDPFMFRLGGAYYGSPYKDKELKAHRIQAGGGLGFRANGMFIDLSYAHIFNKDVQFPYRLNDKPNTFAEQTGNSGKIMLTVGFKI